MRKLVVLAALCAGTMLVAAPGSAKADHLSHSGGYGYAPGPGYGGGVGGYGYGPGYGGGIGTSGPYDGCGYGYGSYGFRPLALPYNSRYIDPYHGVRLQYRAYQHSGGLLSTPGFGFYYSR